MALIPGTPGNDILKATAGSDEFQGGDGFDFVDYSDAPLNTESLEPNSGVVTDQLDLSDERQPAEGDFIVGDTFDSIEGFIGSRWNDIIQAVSDNVPVTTVLRGGQGNDQYFVDGDDKIEENPGEGDSDEVIYRGAVGTSYTLEANVERLSIWPVNFISNEGVKITAKGNDSDNVIFSAAEFAHNISNNTLYGLGGDDLLIAAVTKSDQVDLIGGDTLIGGLGNDNYEFNLLTPAVIIEQAGEGSQDSIRLFSPTAKTYGQLFGSAELAYSLEPHANIENIYYGGARDTNFVSLRPGDEPDLAIRLRGNARHNEIVGGDANDTLSGLFGNDSLIGGDGQDILLGGKGNDYYEVDSAQDRVVERRGEGTDTIGSRTTAFSLNTSQHAAVENLIAVEYPINDVGDLPSDPLARDFTGNALANKIVGGRGTDILRGLGGDDWLLGGPGNDVLIGGRGNDDYDVSPGDVVRESRGGGKDTVRSDGNYVLPQNVENLIFNGVSAPFTGTGNGLANILIGGSGGDTLRGLGGNDTVIGLGGDDALIGGRGADEINGGRGNDTLLGGQGPDSFVFDTRLNSRTNVDVLRDFRPVNDTIFLDVQDFRQVGIAGTFLSENAFHIGARAQDIADRIVYNLRTGALYYDPDGSGAAAQIKFAELSSKPALSSLDIALF